MRASTRPKAQLTPGRGFYANLSKRLRCYWSFACLAELFYLRSNGRKLLAKLLLGVVTIFHFQRGLSEYCFDVFRVHSDLVSIKMRGVAELLIIRLEISASRVAAESGRVEFSLFESGNARRAMCTPVV